MPLHPQSAALIKLDEESGLGSLQLMSAAQARALFDVLDEAVDGVPEPVAEVRDLSIPTSAGPLGLRLYRPGPGTPPVVVWIHGGGWVLGDLETVDGTCRVLANAAQAVVVSVDYRRAPEHRFPSAADDCETALRWVREHAAELDVDAGRMAIGGSSAGGNLAAVVARRQRDSGAPPLRLQVLIYPVADWDLDTPSYREFATGYGLSRDDMAWFWDNYVPQHGRRSDPDASPLRARDLGGVAPALVLTAEYDPLRDEGEAYAEHLRAAGVPTVLSRYDGHIHGFFGSFGAVDAARQAADEVAAALREAFARP